MKRWTRHIGGALTVGLSLYLAVGAVMNLSAATEAFRGLWLASESDLGHAIQRLLPGSPERVRQHLLVVRLRLQLDDPGLERSIGDAKQTISSYLAEINHATKNRLWLAAALSFAGLAWLWYGHHLRRRAPLPQALASSTPGSLLSSLASLPAVLCTANGSISWVSPAFCHATSLAADQVLGQQLTTMTTVLAGDQAPHQQPGSGLQEHDPVSHLVLSERTPFVLKKTRLGKLTAAVLVSNDDPEVAADDEAQLKLLRRRNRELEATTKVLANAKAVTEAELIAVQKELNRIRRHSSLEHLAVVGAVLNAADPMLLCDAHGRVHSCNAAWYKLSGLTKELTLYRPIEILLQQVGIELAEIDDAGHVIECVIRKRRYLCRINPARVDGCLAQFIVSIQPAR